MKPNFRAWKLAKCKVFLDARGVPGPDPNPWTMTVAQMKTLLPKSVAARLSTHFWRADKELIRNVVVSFIDAGDVPGLAAWRAKIATFFPTASNRPLPPKPPDPVAVLEAALAEALDIIDGLAEQQAVPDDSYVPRRARLAALLAPH